MLALLGASILVAPQPVPLAAAVSTPSFGAPTKKSPNPATLQKLRDAVAERNVADQKKKKKKAVKDDRWNIVVIMTDDQPTGTLFDMRTVKRELMGRGVTYSTAVVPTPICCPSRASFLTGDFSQKTGVWDNTGADGNGGYSAFKANGNEARTFAVSLRDSGYYTGLFGKYLNEYAEGYKGIAPAGWDQWRSFAIPGRSGDYRNYQVATPYSKEDRARIRIGKKPKNPSLELVDEYSTTYFGKLTAKFIRTAPKDQPFATVFTPYAPHAGFKAETKYQNSLTDTEWWKDDPSIMEADVSDKPRWVGERLLGGTIAKKSIGERFVKQRATLLSVDDEVSRIMDALRDTKRLKRTVVVYYSDNGFLHGQHRVLKKFVPYRAATDVPMVVRWGNQTPRGVTDNRVVAANIDSYATIMDIAGLPNIKGHSLLDPASRAGVPLTAPEYSTHEGGRPPYCGWRTGTEMFVRYGSGEEEYYDYGTDPYELENRAADPTVAPRVDELRDLARQACLPPPLDYGPSFDEPIWSYDNPKAPDDGETDE